MHWSPWWGTWYTYGLFTLPDSDSDSNSNFCGYIALCKSFHTARSQIQIPILTANYKNGIGVRVRIWVRLSQCKWAITHARILVWHFPVTGDDDNSNDDDDDTFYTTWYFLFLFTTMVCTFPCLFANSHRFVYMMSFTLESFIKATFIDILIH